jgi:hypothetical protein
MAIEKYFAEAKKVLDQYAATRLVLEVQINFDIRPGEQGLLSGSVTFIDGSVLFFKEFLDAIAQNVDKLMYSYHYQDMRKNLIFRYDNARHQPLLATLEHKHTPEKICEAPSPTLRDVLLEIITSLPF